MACYHGLRVLVHSLKHGDPNKAQQAERTLLQSKAIQMLKKDIDAGHRDFAGIRRDRDFRHLHGVPEFEALFPKKKPE